jgi:hypothetical protein
MSDDEATPEQFCALLDRFTDIGSRVQVVVGDLAQPVAGSSGCCATATTSTST